MSFKSIKFDASYAYKEQLKLKPRRENLKIVAFGQVFSPQIIQKQ